jgi:hypothetical protein
MERFLQLSYFYGSETEYRSLRRSNGVEQFVPESILGSFGNVWQTFSHDRENHFFNQFGRSSIAEFLDIFTHFAACIHDTDS